MPLEFTMAPKLSLTDARVLLTLNVFVLRIETRLRTPIPTQSPFVIENSFHQFELIKYTFELSLPEYY